MYRASFKALQATGAPRCTTVLISMFISMAPEVYARKSRAVPRATRVGLIVIARDQRIVIEAHPEDGAGQPARHGDEGRRSGIDRAARHDPRTSTQQARPLPADPEHAGSDDPKATGLFWAFGGHGRGGPLRCRAELLDPAGRE